MLACGDWLMLETSALESLHWDGSRGIERAKKMVMEIGYYVN